MTPPDAEASRIRPIAVCKLVPTADNPRRIDPGSESIRLLVESIKAVGILHPLIARPHPTRRGRYELRAGHRRLIAAKLAGWKEVPVDVQELSDGQALAITIAENIDRQDLRPLEEGRLCALLIERGYSIDQAARELGKSPTWVAGRARLTNLTPAVQRVIERPGSCLHDLSASYLALIARLPASAQDRLVRRKPSTLYSELDHMMTTWQGRPGLAQFDRMLRKDLALLRAMPWDPNDESLVPRAGSCTSCPKRSGLQPLLFEGDEASTSARVTDTDRCLDASCYEKKRLAHLRRVRDLLVARGLPPSTITVVDDPDEHGAVSAVAAALGLETVKPYGLHRVSKSERGARAGLIAVGGRAGSVIYYTPGRTSNSRTTTGRRTDGRPGPTPLSVRRANLRRRRLAAVVGWVREYLESLNATAAARILDHRKDLSVSALALAFGTAERCDRLGTFRSAGRCDPWVDYQRWVRDGRSGSIEMLLSVIQVFCRRLHFFGMDGIEGYAVEAKRVCDLLGVPDYEKLARQAALDLPEPLSWRGLKADGTPRVLAASTRAKAARLSKRKSGRARTGPADG